MRKGRVFIIKQRGVMTNIVLRPIIPRGWVFIRGNTLAFMGLVFNKEGAEHHIRGWQEYVERQKKATTKAEEWSFTETTTFCAPLLPIAPPEGVVGYKTLNPVGPDDEDETHPFIDQPGLPGYCGSCGHRKNSIQHWTSLTETEPPPKKGESRKMPEIHPMLPMHYAGPKERTAEEREQVAIIETEGVDDEQGTE